VEPVAFVRREARKPRVGRVVLRRVRDGPTVMPAARTGMLEIGVDVTARTVVHVLVREEVPDLREVQHRGQDDQSPSQEALRR
jgi:hypothetical protein